jgi:hypothetical protein
VVTAICRLIRTEGLSDSEAGLLAGVSKSALSRWKLEDEDFAIDLGQARASFVRELLRAIREAKKRDGTPDWRAQTWVLKNCSADGYGRASRKRKETDDAAAEGQERILVTPSELELMVERRVDERLREMANDSTPRSAMERAMCPEIPETRERSGTGVVAARPEAVDGENVTFRPEIHGAVQGAGSGAAETGAEGGDEECKNVAFRPEIPEIHDRLATTQTGTIASGNETPRGSRRERRAEERRLAKQMKQARKGAGGMNFRAAA